jgi:hypothetical protein
MGDRCYMSVTCRRQDRDRFEELGFHLEFESSPESPVIEMVDEEANYAHANDMPADIPYYGYNSAGGHYGDGQIVCDGKEYDEMETGRDGGFVVVWDYRNKKPTKQCLANIRRFIVVHKRAEHIIGALREPLTQ